MEHPTGPGAGGAEFRETLWTNVLRARGGSREALEKLILQYWRPVYWFVRRRGQDRERARDVTQGFFAKLLEQQALANADPERGRFRTYLLAVLKHYLADERDWREAKKRGGGVPELSIEVQEAGPEPATEETPEREFHRRWAKELFDRALARLTGEFPDSFEALQEHLSGSAGGYASVAARLRISEPAAAARAHRMRKRLRQLVLDEVRQTVSSSGSLQQELVDLREFL